MKIIVPCSFQFKGSFFYEKDICKINLALYNFFLCSCFTKVFVQNFPYFRFPNCTILLLNKKSNTINIECILSIALLDLSIQISVSCRKKFIDSVRLFAVYDFSVYGYCSIYIYIYLLLSWRLRLLCDSNVRFPEVSSLNLGLFKGIWKYKNLGSIKFKH